MSRLHIRVLPLFAVAALLAALSAVPGMPPARAASLNAMALMGSTRNLVSSASPGSLADVDASSPTSAWAVGDQCASSACNAIATLILRWDGTSWSQITSPDPSAGIDTLASVSATSSTDAWAVGYSCPTTNCTVQHTLILHWNGSAWSTVASSGASADTDSLDGVKATSAKAAWAVGYYCAAQCNSISPQSRTLVLRWNGKAWSKVASPDPSGDNVLDAVTATSSTSAWAVGEYCGNPCGVQHTLILRWNGKAWSKIKSPSPDSAGTGTYLYGVTSPSPTDAWADGYYCTSSLCHTVTLHWNGTTWSKIASPNPNANSGGSLLFGVTATSSTDAWATGASCEQCGQEQVVILHWDGSAWAQN